jgi:hypothetical protein
MKALGQEELTKKLNTTNKPILQILPMNEKIKKMIQ